MLPLLWMAWHTMYVPEALIRFEREHFELDVNSLPIMFDSLGTECEGNDWILMQPLNGTRTHTTRAVWICIETLYTEYTPLHTLRGKRPVSLKIKDSLQWREWVQKNPDPRDVSKLCSATQTIAFICYTPILLLWTIYFLQLVQCPVSPICRLQPFWFD